LSMFRDDGCTRLYWTETAELRAHLILRRFSCGGGIVFGFLDGEAYVGGGCFAANELRSEICCYG
jgi:hypothetical protein